MSDQHGAEKEDTAQRLFRAAVVALVQAGLPQETHVQLVFDQTHMEGDPNAIAVFGSIPTDRLHEIVSTSVARQRERQANAVSALARFTLSGEIRTPLNGANDNG